MSRRDPGRELIENHRKTSRDPVGYPRQFRCPNVPAAVAVAASLASMRLSSAAYSRNSTVVPTLTILASSVASQLVSRTQPWLCVLPIFDGSGVP
ncbi:hypothetical protein DFI02_102456 [Rhizobium sp. PP-F2F-G20b]|nr:hypothetical protein DFI02_102456 [Rhizobium sp. PP-F2F-G20b]